MQEQQETQRTATQVIQNYDYIQYRLNNIPVVQKFEDTLSGIRRVVKYSKEARDYEEVIEPMGNPLINDEGKHAIIGYFSILANPSTVQGNLTREQLNIELRYISKHLNKSLALNSKKWECYHTRRLIHNQFIDNLNIYLTRPVDNLERESYIGTMQKESTTIKQTPEKRLGFI